MMSQNDVAVHLYKPLKSRFYILFNISLFNFLCGFMWSAWTPIMISVKQLYNWTSTEINLQANLFSIAFCVLVVPIVYLWNMKGIQFIYFMSSALLVIGTGLRLYPCSIMTQSILVQLGSAIIGVGSVISLIIPPVISMLWFPTGERTRATAIPLSFNTLGTALAPIIATSMVSVSMVNATGLNSTSVIEQGIHRFIFLQCAIAIATLVMAVAYFPEKPHVQPCKSSDASLRLDLWSGTKLLMVNKQYWITFIVNMIVYGFNSAVSVVSVTYVIPMGVTQNQAGLLSFISNILSVLSCQFGGWLGDKISYKSIILASVPTNVILYTLGGLQCLKVIPQSLTLIYTIGVLQGLFGSIATSASFEMAVETAFPVSEEVSTAMISFATNVGCLLFLSVCMITSIGTAWIPFAYAFFSLLLLPLMWFYKDERKRQKYDNVLFPGAIIEVEGVQEVPSSDRSPLLA